jgi:hypothetical protein
MIVLLPLLVAGPAAAHEERESRFPPGDGEVPTHRTFEEAADVLVVCKPDSAQRIKAIMDRKLRAFNNKLLAQCSYQHLQAAVDDVEQRGSNIYVLPGQYREEPSWNPECVRDYDGGVVEYEQIESCGEILNLVTVAGDDPGDPDITCDNQLCDLQIEGTGEHARDVVLTGGFNENGDWVKHNGIKADRADGFYLKNMAFELFAENAIYVHETDGYVLDDVVARHNDLYGILTFTSDHGLITGCETHHNGDSGVYPGSPADVNAYSDRTGALERWAVEITGCDTHHNALGFSGTAGNSVYFHDNEVHDNSAGYVTDSFVGGHPGMPQDHAWLQDNQIYANNVNYYPNVADGGPCRAEKPADRGHEDGVVCPAFPVPVGTGVMIAGGNHNLVTSNEIYDNWRYGAMLFWIPAGIRGDYDPTKQQDTSHHNAFTANQMGYRPGDAVLPNGLDFWWDDAGNGNCWDDNLAAPGTKITHNATDPRGLPECPGGSTWPVGNLVKSAQLVPCAEYNRKSNPEPAGCDWMQTPQRPGSEQQDSGPVNEMSSSGTGWLGALFGAGVLGAAAVWLRRGRTTRSS